MSYQGLDVPRGVSAVIGITSEEIRRLPYPYTNCSSDNREKQLLVEAIQVRHPIVHSRESKLFCESLAHESHPYCLKSQGDWPQPQVLSRPLSIVDSGPGSVNQGHRENLRKSMCTSFGEEFTFRSDLTLVLGVWSFTLSKSNLT